MKRFVTVLVVFAVCTSTGLARKWTDSTGKHTVEAEFVGFSDGKVLLKVQGENAPSQDHQHSSREVKRSGPGIGWDGGSRQKIVPIERWQSRALRNYRE